MGLSATDSEFYVGTQRGRQEALREVLELIEAERGYSPLTLHDCCSYEKLKAKIEEMIAKEI